MSLLEIPEKCDTCGEKSGLSLKARNVREKGKKYNLKRFICLRCEKFIRWGRMNYIFVD